MGCLVSRIRQAGNKFINIWEKNHNDVIHVLKECKLTGWMVQKMGPNALSTSFHRLNMNAWIRLKTILFRESVANMFLFFDQVPWDDIQGYNIIPRKKNTNEGISEGINKDKGDIYNVSAIHLQCLFFWKANHLLCKLENDFWLTPPE